MLDKILAPMELAKDSGAEDRTSTMCFDKKYPDRKDKRRPYRNSKAIDRTCCNQGSCGWCEGNRTHSTRRQAIARIAQQKEELGV